MPALAHLLGHWLLGAYAAWVSRRAPSLMQHVFGWPLMAALSSAGTLLVPITTYQARMYPSHAAGYALNPELHPLLFARVGPVTVALQLGYLAALCAGFALARHGIVAGRRALVAGPSIAALGGLLAYLWAVGGNSFIYGSYSAVWAHEATAFSHTPSAWCVPLAYAGCGMLLARLAHWAGDRPLHWP